MSLNPEEQAATKYELNENKKISGLSNELIAQDLNTTPDYVEDIFDLTVSRIEDPWIMRNYLNQKITENGDTPYPYSKLMGNPRHYFFLDNHYIENGKIEY